MSDWCFGLVKQAFICHGVSSLEELASVMNGSAAVNTAQLYFSGFRHSLILILQVAIPLVLLNIFEYFFGSLKGILFSFIVWYFSNSYKKKTTTNKPFIDTEKYFYFTDVQFTSLVAKNI